MKYQTLGDNIHVPISMSVMHSLISNALGLNVRCKASFLPVICILKDSLQLLLNILWMKYQTSINYRYVFTEL